jgi:exopolysaccharide production protein ExoY
VSNPQTNDPFARSLDFACIVLAFAGASGIASLLSTIGLFTWPGAASRGIDGWPADYVILLVSSLVLWAPVSAYVGVHRADRLESSRIADWRLIRALLLWVGCTGTAIFFLKLQTVSRQFNLSFFSLASCLILLRQLIERSLYIRRARHRKSLRSAIVIGPNRESEWLLKVLSAKPQWYGTVTHPDLEEVESILNGNGHHVADRLTTVPAEVFILPGSVDPSLIEEWVLRLLHQGRTVHVVPTIIDAQLFRHNFGDIAGVPTLTLETGRQRELEVAIKRAVDAVVAMLLILLFTPVMAVVTLLIKRTSPGPALFVQERLGKHGKLFKILKFRTMLIDAEEMLRSDPQLYRKYKENNFKLPEGEDNRVTKLGRLLRASSLDELPQLINVLRGEMSLVGPRPIVPEEIKEYGEYGSLLLMVKPGMTGNWQVNGRSRIVEYSQRVKLDMEYVRDQSLSADLRILVRTLGAVTKMDGAH